MLSYFKKRSGSIKRVESNPKARKPFRHDIQALRALAVAAVVLYHLWPNRIIGGFAGVDIFFVISGFLMTTSIMGHLKPHIVANSITIKNVLHLLSEFYARRIRRLVPAALATLTGVLVMAYLTNNLTIMVNTAKNVISSATFWQNWHLADQSVDYLRSGDAPVATEHFWSLSVEEQFYIMWPLLLVLATLLTINIVVYYKKQRISGAILPITLLTIISFAYGFYLTQSEPSMAYFSTPARIWELMIGGIIAFLPVIKNYDLKLLLPHLGLVMCLYSIFFINGDGFPGWHALIPTIGTALIIWSGIDRVESRLSFEKLFSLKPIQWIGNISYSIYLWHWPLVVLLPVLIHQDIEGPHGKYIKLGILVLSLILAQLSYTYIEETTRKVRLKARSVYLLFLLATGLVVGGGFTLQNYGTTQLDTRLTITHTAALNESDVCFGARAVLNQDKCNNPYGAINDNTLSVGTADEWGVVLSSRERCYLFSNKLNDTSKYCTFGDTKSSKYILLLGDSHAEQYINTFDQVGRANDMKIIMYNLGTCSGLGLAKNEEDKVCIDRYDFLKRSNLLSNSTHVVMSSAYKSYTDISKLIKLTASMTDKNIYLVNDNPRYTSTLLDNCYILQVNCSRPKADAMNAVNNITSELISNSLVSESDVIDLTDAYCDHSRCYASIGGAPVYYNTKDKGKDDRSYYNSHTNQSYSLSMSHLLEQKLKQKGLLKQ